MPSVSLNQIKFMQEELKALRAGKPRKTTLTEDQLLEYTQTPWQGLPTKVKPPKK